MVRNKDLRPTSAATKRLAVLVSDALTARGHAPKDVVRMLGRAQSYVSVRLRGLEPWDTDELDLIATQLLGYRNMTDMIVHLSVPRDGDE